MIFEVKTESSFAHLFAKSEIFPSHLTTLQERENKKEKKVSNSKKKDSYKKRKEKEKKRECEAFTD